MARSKRDPRTKEEFLDRILRFDFSGDIREIGAEPASIVRTGPNSLRLTFPVSGQTFDVTVHKPRGEQRAAESRSFSPPPREQPRADEPRIEAEVVPPKRKYTRRKPPDERRAQEA